MRKKTKSAKIRRDKDGYEYGGPDLSGMRILTGEERERLLSRIRRGPPKPRKGKVSA